MKRIKGFDVYETVEEVKAEADHCLKVYEDFIHIYNAVGDDKRDEAHARVDVFRYLDKACIWANTLEELKGELSYVLNKENASDRERELVATWLKLHIQ